MSDFNLSTDLYILGLLIIVIIGLIVGLIYDLKIKYLLAYKRILVDDTYIREPADPWAKPKIIRIIDKKNNWLRIYVLNEKYYDSIKIQTLVDQNYKLYGRKNRENKNKHKLFE